jgi:glycerol-3-phosphate dehydrogenase
VTDFLYDADMVAGVKAKDKVSGQSFTVSASYVINAAGPWVDHLRALNNSNKGKRLYLTKGVHLVFPYEKLPVKQSVYFDVPDGRMIFAIPRGKITYVGTTDTHYNQDKDKVTTDLADAIYLISAVNNMFPSISLEMDDIVSSWAGLRPLINEEGKSASELSRKDEIFVSGTGLISIAGGKLTGYRKMAERVVNRIAAKMEENLNRNVDPCNTMNIPLCGNGFKNYKKVKKYIRDIEERIVPEGLSKYHAWFLVTTYGVQAEEILDIFGNLEDSEPEARLIRAELQFGIRFEMVETPMDFFIRRTGRIYFDIGSVRRHMDTVLSEFSIHMGPDDARIASWKVQLESAIEEHSDFSLNRG